MKRNGDAASLDRAVDFFISYSPADERWATWIAWELEAAGHSVMLQAWDFVPGTHFLDFMDRGVSGATVVIAVLSRSYLRSRYGKVEWQATFLGDPENVASRLVTIRVEECPLEGLLAMITYVDLVGVSDPDQARTLLLRRIRDALDGRAKPARAPSYPTHPTRPPAVDVAAGPGGDVYLQSRPSYPYRRRSPATAPIYPPAAPADRGPRPAITLLHVPGPRFDRDPMKADGPTAAELQSRIWADLTRLTDDGAPQPDLLVITGNLTEASRVGEFAEATEFLTGLRVLLGLEPHRLVLVPGNNDVSQRACQAYFANCEADEIKPMPPYWPKWRHFHRLFEELYQGLDDLVFDSHQPWTLFPMPDLQVVVAGINSTINDSHLLKDHYGWIGEAQAAWFAHRLRPFEDEGWLRIGTMRHAPPRSDSVAGTDPELLRDASTLDRLLGRQLNLLVCGPAPAGCEIGTLPSGLTVIPPAGPTRFQLLQLTAAGLVRWAGSEHLEGTETGVSADPKADHPAQANKGPERLQRQWHAVGGTFVPAVTDAGGRDLPASGRRPDGFAVPVKASVDPRSEQEERGDPVVALLDRIAEVCETQYDNAKIRRIDGKPPYLVVTYRDGQFFRRQQVAAHVGELTHTDIERFLSEVQAVDPDLSSELVYEGPRISQAVREEAVRRKVRLRSFIEFQGLLDLRDFVAAQTTRLRADPYYPPDLYVPQRFRELVGSDRSVHTDLVEELMRLVAIDDGRFVLVLGDFGRGKTFALRQVASRIPTEHPNLIPIFIELRKLDKAHSVAGLVAAHLADFGEEHIDLKAFNYMLRQGRVVLLFDGFDELAARVTYERAADHLETLLAAAEGKAKIVVCSRTQHFKTDAQVLTALGERVGVLPHRRVVSIEDFTTAQIREYLVNRYGSEDAAETRLHLLSGTEDFVGLARNPRMLSFIADLDDGRLRTVMQAKRVVSAARLYEEILEAWLTFEEERTHGIRGAPPSLTRPALWQAVGTLAVRLWESQEPLLRPAELVEVADTLAAMAKAQLSPDQAAHAVGAGSLLVRTDEGLFGFIHGSVVEWLVAKEIAAELAKGSVAPAMLSRRTLSQLTVDFLCDLADPDAAHAWMERVLADPDAADAPRANALKISNRLRTTGRTDLRGAMLRGEDLSHRDFADADLSGADLSDARLVGTRLNRASLRDARLAGARLDEATLTGADLTGADLTRARMLRTDLRDIVLTGSRWGRAALIDVRAGSELLRAGELRGAAVSPGQQTDTEFAPAAIGVQYGFEFGRLPQPIAYSPDGGLLAIGSDDGGVLICDTVSGRPLRTLRAHSGRVYAVAYGPGDTVLATAASDGTAILWDPVTGERLRQMTGHQDWVWPMVLSPDTSMLLTGDRSGTIRLWDTATGQLRYEYSGHAERVWTAAFRPDGALLVTGDSAGAVRLWDTATGQLRQELSGHVGGVYRLTFSPSGKLLATVDHGGRVSLWDPATGTLRDQLTGHTARIYALDFHPSGALLASGDTDGTVLLWDATNGRRQAQLTGHTGAVYWVTFSPDGTLLASGDSDGGVRLWESAAGQLRYKLTEHKSSVWPAVFRPDGRQFATSSNDGTTRLWDPMSGQCRQVLRGHGRQITSVQFNADGSLLATSGNDGVVRLWHTRTGQRYRKLAGSADRLVSAFFNPTNTQLATATSDGGISLWNIESGDAERELNVETDHVWAAIFSPDGDVLATANDDDSVRLWYRTTGRQILSLSEHKGRVRSIAFSPDGGVIATGCDDSKVRLWDAETGVCRATLIGHSDRVYAVMFNREGSLLVSASNDGTARLWDPRTGGQLNELTRHTGRLWSAAFSPDGTVVATAGDDLVVRLWDTRGARELSVLPGHTRRVWSVAFSPDGSLLASGGDDGTVHIWDVADPSTARRKMTLLGLPENSWAALAPDGGYKLAGDVKGQFWHVIGMCRFEPGELDNYVPEVRQVPLAAEL